MSTERTDCGRFGSLPQSRREFLQRSGLGFGTLALAALLADEKRLFAGQGGTVDASRLSGRAKSVILLFMGGGPSQIDTWDPKPELGKLAGQKVPESIARLVPKITRQRLENLYPSPYEFTPRGESGIPVSELYRETGKWVDELCVIRSMSHTSPVHTPAEYLFTTGSLSGTRPSLGAWLYYGLGSENRNLPGFVVLLAGENCGGPACWAQGFLPARFQGTVVSAAAGIRHIQPPEGVALSSRRRQLDILSRLNHRHAERLGGNSELEARIESYVLAFRSRPRRRKPLTFPGNPRKLESSTASTDRNAPSTREIACSPAGWWSAACGSSSSIKGAGMRTAISRKITRSSP